MRTTATRSAILLSVGVALVMVLTAGQVLALTYSVSVQTDVTTYSGTQPVVISGTVSPPPGNSTAVFIKVYNPNSVLVIVANAAVNSTTGAFRDTEVTGGTSNWIAGQYLVNATWGAYGSVISGTATFQYATQNATTSTTNSTTTSSSTNSTTSSSSSTTSSTTSTTSSTTTSSVTTSSTTSSTTTSFTTSSTTSSSTTTSSTIVITTSSTVTPTTSTTTSTASSSSISPYFTAGVVTAVALAALAMVLGRRKARSYGIALPEALAP